MNKTNLNTTLFFLFFLILFLSPVFAVDYNGDTGTRAGNYTGNAAAGTFVERQANSSDNSFSSIIFGWSGPVINGTNENGISTAAFGISASGDIYVVSFGPKLEDVASVASVEEEVSQPLPSSSIPSSSIGGGGGSSHRDTYGLTAGDILTIVINGETHTITVDSVREEKATLTVESISTGIDFTVGETKKLDITSTYPGTDVAITLDSVSDLRQIVITVEDLTQKTEEEEKATEEVSQEQQKPDLLQTITGSIAAIQSQQVQEAAKEVKQGITTATKWILLLNIALGILAGTGIAAKKLQQRRIYNVFHQKTKQESIAEELKKVEAYVKQAMRQGYHYEEIKEQLLGADWQEYEVDEVIVNAMLAEKQEIYTRRHKFLDI